jgi:hypothetical protein
MAQSREGTANRPDRDPLIAAASNGAAQSNGSRHGEQRPPKQLELFSEFELPIAVRPHRVLNYERDLCTGRAARLAALRRDHVAACESLLRDASVSMAEVKRLWPKTEELSRQIDELEREIVDTLNLIETDRIAHVERMLVKIGGKV